MFFEQENITKRKKCSSIVPHLPSKYNFIIEKSNVFKSSLSKGNIYMWVKNKQNTTKDYLG